MKDYPSTTLRTSLKVFENRPLARIEGVWMFGVGNSDARFDNFLTRNDLILSVA